MCLINGRKHSLLALLEEKKYPSSFEITKTVVLNFKIVFCFIKDTELVPLKNQIF
jgi:hypothetical protein